MEERLELKLNEDSNEIIVNILYVNVTVTNCDK